MQRLYRKRPESKVGGSHALATAKAQICARNTFPSFSSTTAGSKVKTRRRAVQKEPNETEVISQTTSKLRVFVAPMVWGLEHPIGIRRSNIVTERYS
jgi:hypothetical protein